MTNETTNFINYTGPKYSGGLRYTMMYITPELAKEMLSGNDINRSLTRATVNKYKTDMLSGLYQSENGQTVSFFRSGKLKDGQHRLTAIVESGIAQWILVVEGIKDEDVIADIGKPRTIGNIMEMSGYNATLRANSATGSLSFLFLLGTGNNSVSYQEKIAFADKYEDIIVPIVRASHNGAADSSSRMRKSPIIAALICANYCGVSQELILKFCRSVNSGLYDGDTETSTVFLARAIDLPRKYNKTKEKELLFDITLAALDDYINSRPRKKPYGAVRQHKWKKEALYAFFPDTYNPEA